MWKFFAKVLDSWRDLEPKFKYPALIFIIVCVSLILSQGNAITYFSLLALTVFIIIFPEFQGRLNLRDAKKAKEYDRIQAILKKLATSEVRSVKDTSLIVKKLLKEISENIEITLNKDQITSKLIRFEEKLNEFMQELDDTTANANEWANAGKWLEEQQKHLVEKAVSNVLNKNKWLEKNKSEFEENIYEHLKWAITNLRDVMDSNNVIDSKVKIIDFDKKVLILHKFTTATEIYPEAFESIKKEIEINNELSPSTKEIILHFIESILLEYQQ